MRTVNREARPARCYHCLDEDILRDLHRVVLDILWQTKLLATPARRDDACANNSGRLDRTVRSMRVRALTTLNRFGVLHHA